MPYLFFKRRKTLWEIITAVCKNQQSERLLLHTEAKKICLCAAFFVYALQKINLEKQQKNCRLARLNSKGE